jgi:pilus assembly protein CpaC
MLLSRYRLQQDLNQGEMMDKFQQKLKSGARKASAFTPSAVLVAATAAAAFSYPHDAQAAKAAAQPATPVCVGEMKPSVTMRVAEGKSGTLDLAQLNIPAPAWLRAVGNPEIVQIEPLTSAAPRNMFFAFGKKVGATNLMFQNREGRCAVVEINVGIDTAAVRSSLHELMPGETGIKVTSAANSLVLSGTASDAGAVERIMTIAGAFVRKDGGNDSAQDRIVNMMSVGSPQQVML